MFFAKKNMQKKYAIKPLEQTYPQNNEIIMQKTKKEYQNKIHQFFHPSDDLVEYILQLKTGKEAFLYYLEGLTDNAALKNNVVLPLLEAKQVESVEDFPMVISVYMKKVHTWEEITSSILEGQSVIFLEGISTGYVIQTKGGTERGIEEPTSESIIRGAHDGFVESAATNIGLIRGYLPSKELKVKKSTVGDRAKTSVYFLYLSDVANKDILEEAEYLVGEIRIDTIIHVGELARFMQQDIWTPFPQFFTSERPDTIVKHILDGKIAIVLDHSPSVMIIPINLAGFFQTADDYNISWSIASFLRFLRVTGFVLAVLLPAIYIAIVNYHFEIIPLDLYLSIAKSRVKVPFSPLVEALIMEFTIEMLREAGIRLPQPTGQTIGIVGGIVVGQAAVQAGLVSNIMVIVVSITAISSFIVPNYDLSSCIRLLRFPMMILAYLYGIVGIISGVMVLIAHLVTLKSFGVPYSLPLAPFIKKDWKDMLIRFPSSLLSKRSQVANPQQEVKKTTEMEKGDRDD